MTVVSNHEMLCDHTTLRVGGFADRIVLATTEAEILQTVKECDEKEIPLLILGGGSNVVISDEGFRGTVLLVRTSGYEVSSDACSGAMVTVQAGHNWDDFVAETINKEWYGIEALSGIPGTVGATPSKTSVLMAKRFHKLLRTCELMIAKSAKSKLSILLIAYSTIAIQFSRHTQTAS